MKQRWCPCDRESSFTIEREKEGEREKKERKSERGEDNDNKKKEREKKKRSRSERNAPKIRSSTTSFVTQHGVGESIHAVSSVFLKVLESYQQYVTCRDDGLVKDGWRWEGGGLLA